MSWARALGQVRRRWPRRVARRPHASDLLPNPTPQPRAAHAIEALWCDIHGVFIRGWAHAHEERLTRLVLRCGAAQAELDRFDPRPDVGAIFPDAPFAAESGFSLYLACEPFRPVALSLAMESGTVELDLTVPPDLRKPTDPALTRAAPTDAFIAEMKAKRGAVVEIGGRVVGAMSGLWAQHFQPECRFIATDIHPAPGVDLVCDAHALSRHLVPGSVDGVFSLAVLEHLAAPWVVAAEINRVLRIGGLTLHLVPQTWPVHEQPNDFWRFTDEALKVLFGPPLGFEVVDSGLTIPMQVIPSPVARVGAYLEIPMNPGMGGAFIMARKTADLADGAVAWPMPREAMEAQSRAYPAHDQGQRRSGP